MIFVAAILLVLVILLLAGCLVIFVYLAYDTRTAIGFVPMPQATINAVIAALELRPEAVIVDLGAGDGRVLTAALHAEPTARIIGYERNPVLALRRLIYAPLAEWHRGDLMQADVSKVTHVIVYLTAQLNAKLAPKLRAELAPGTIVVSVRTDLPGWTPRREIQVTGAPAHAVKLFVYTV